MQDFLGKAGGLFNRLTGGANQLGLGALMYGSSQIQEPLKRTFGLPTTGDYLRQWEAQKTNPMQRAQVGQPMILGGRLGYKAADGTWQPRGDMESENIPQYTQGRGYLYDEPQPARQPGGTQQPPAPSAPLDPNAAKNRAYQQERARVEAMVKANPDMQKQEIADARAKVRDQGMTIWQQKYGNTPMGQPGGATGRFNPLMDRTFGYQSGSAPDQQMGAPTLGPSPLVPQVDQSLNPASPNFIGGEGAPIMNFADPRFENMSPEEFQKLLNQVNKK